MVTISDVQKGIAAYIDAELMPKMPTQGFEKILAGTAISLGIQRSGKIIQGYKDNKMVQMLGIMDQEGKIDVDALADALKENIPMEGVKIDIPVIGILTFHKEDVTKLHEYIVLSL